MSAENQERNGVSLSVTRLGKWEWEPGTGAMRWDDGMHQVFGSPAEAFSGKFDDFLGFIHADDEAPVVEGLKEALETSGEFDGDFRIVWPADGSVHHLRVRGIVCGDKCDGAPLVMGACWESLERKREGEPVHKEKILLRALMNHLPDNIYFKDLDSRFITMNRAMAEYFGVHDPDEMSGKTDFDVFSEEHAALALEDEREIIRTGNPLVNLVEKETWPDGDETWASTTKLPLRDLEGQIIGTFGLSRDITARKKAEEQLAKVAEELRQKNEALQEELAMARELQYTMLPQHFPKFPVNGSGTDAVKFFHFYQPSTAVSGDFFDVFKISDDKAGLFICDVMGHGVRAALVAATTRALVGELRSSWTRPGEFLAELNKALRRSLRHARTPLFASAFYAVADLASSELCFANAGHPRPLWIHSTSECSMTQPLGDGCRPGPALGLFDDPCYQSVTAGLSPNDTLLLFTDGLFEVEDADGQVYDYHRLINAVDRRSNLSIKEMCRGVVSEVQAFSPNREFTDDVCLVAMQVDKCGELLKH